MNNVLVNKEFKRRLKNKMTNFEKHKNKIIELLKLTDDNVPAVVNGVPIKCEDVTHCTSCEFNNTKYPNCDTCWIDFLEWVCEDDGELKGCDGCKYEYKREDESPCTECCSNYTSKWERRPKKTRQDEFLEHYPNVKKCYGVVDICPKDLDMHFYCRSQELLSGGCTTCCQDYWLQEVEE